MPTMRFVKALYEVQAEDQRQAGEEIAWGQSVGNPYIRAIGDSPKLIAKHKARILKQEGGRMLVGYPLRNFGIQDGANYLLSVLMGGQCDIDNIRGCRLVELEMPELLKKRYLGPRYGMQGIRKMTGAYDRPLIGAIVKPKIGLTPVEVAKVAVELAEGGADFIKEDEILSNQSWSPFLKRVKEVSEALKGSKVVYAPCITSDPDRILRRAYYAESMGMKAVHFNLWAGLGMYATLRRKTNLALFFQKSGDKVWTTGAYSIDYAVICQLINLIGCDFAHVGMYGGYMSEQVGVIAKRISALGQTIPSFSCGAHPGLVRKLVSQFGNDIMITAGGSVHGHGMGCRAGVKAFRDAIGGYTQPSRELAWAIKKWGIS